MPTRQAGNLAKKLAIIATQPLSHNDVPVVVRRRELRRHTSPDLDLSERPACGVADVASVNSPAPVFPPNLRGLLILLSQKVADVFDDESATRGTHARGSWNG